MAKAMKKPGPEGKDASAQAAPVIPALSQQAINDILDYATVFQRDLDGTILFWNQGSSDMYGWSPEEAVGKVSHELLRTVFPEPLAAIQKTLQRRRMWQGELRHRHKDGREIVVASKWILRELSPGTERVVEINSDVTDLVRAEADQARLAAVVASSEAAIFAEDLNGIVTNWNEAAETIFGYRADEIVGRSINLIAPPERPNEMREITERIKSGQRMGYLRTERIRKDGRRITVSVSVSPILDRAGQIVGLSKIVNDVTALASAEADQARLAAIVASSDAAIISKDLDGIVTSWNEGAEAMLGWRADEIVGKPISVIASPDRPDEMREILERIKAGERIAYFETERRHKNGSPVAVSLSVSPILDKGGRIVGASKIANDITQRKRSERELRKVDERFRRVFEKMPHALLMVRSDGQVEAANAHAESTFGYTRDEMRGLPIETLVPERFRVHHPALRDGFLRNPHARPMGSGRDLFAMRKDGSEFPVEIGLNPIPSDDGTIIVASIIDLTERKARDASIRAALEEKEAVLHDLAAEIAERERVSEALRVSEEDLRYFFELSPQWPWACGPDGIVNELPERFAQFLGLSVNEAVNDGWRALNHPEDQAKIDKSWPAALRTGEPYDQEMRTRLPDGEYRWLRIRAFSRKGADGRVLRWYGVIEDVHAQKLAELALAESERDLRSFFELNTQALWVTDIAGNLIHASPLYRQIARLGEEAVRKPQWDVLIHPDDLDAFAADRRAALETGAVHDCEIRILNEADEYRWFRSRVFPRRTPGGEIDRWYGVTEDIHDRKVAELALKSSEQNLRAFFELSPQAPWIGDPNGTPIEVSPQMRKMVRFFTGPKGRAAWPELVHPDDFDEVEKAWGVSLSTGDLLDREYRIKTPAGDFRWFRTRAFSQKDADGKIQRWFGVMEDIHEHKLAQTALKDSEERFRRIYEESPLGIVLLRADNTHIVEINPAAARSLGLEPHEAVGRTFPEILQPADSAAAAALQAGPIDRQWTTMERNFVAKSGKSISARIRISLLPHVDGQPDMILGVSEDITGQRQAEAALAQAQKMEAVGQLTGGIAHDFNNLLSVVIGNLDMLRSMKGADDDVQDLGGEAMSAALRGADLVRRLLAFARKQPLQPTKFDVNEAVTSILKLLGRILGEDIEISTMLGMNIWPVIADQAQLETALANLATNARDAMPGGGALTIATANRHLDGDYTAQHPELNPGDYVMIEVTDSGIGMPPEILAQIFEPFFTTKERGKGSGLGLSMLFGYVKQSGGHVNVYSEPGKGTTFRLYLPRATEGAEAAPSVVPTSDMAFGRGETILVVEDSAALRRIVVRQLKDLGYRVVEAADGAEALDMLKREAVDLLFTDIVMPGKMDGFALAQAAKERWPSVKVLLTSGFPETKLSDQYELAGYRLLSKPYLKEELARLLRATLD